MRKMRSYIIWITVLALMLALAGCGQDEPDPTTQPTTQPTTEPTTVPTEPPLTVEDVYNSVAAAMADAEATRLQMALSYDMSVTEGEGDAATTTDILFDLAMDTMTSADPFGSYTMMDMSVDAGDYAMAYTMEVYLVEEEDSVVSYIQMFDTWTRSDYGMTTKEFIASGQMTEVTTEEIWSSEAMPADMTLDEDTQTLNGTEVYVLRGSIPAGDMSEAFSNLGIEDPTELEDMTLPVVYYVDAQSYLILRMEADMEFMVDLLDDVIAESMMGTETEGAQLELNIPDIVYDLEYGVPDIPAVPQEAYDYIACNPDTSGGETDPTVYDGPLVINCGGEQLLITCPEGWTGEIFGENNVWIYDEEFTLVGDYYYMEGWTDDDVMSFMVQTEIDSLTSMGTYVSHGDGPVIEGYTTMVVIGDGESYYFAWREAGSGLFIAYIYDYTGTDDATELLPQMLGYVSPYSE